MRSNTTTDKRYTLSAATAVLLGIIAPAGADTTLYGSVRLSVNRERVDFDTPHSGVSVSAWDVVDDTSRFGVRGAEALGGGLSAIYQFEFGVDAVEGGNLRSNRPKYAGLKGGFGTLTAGTQYTPYRNVTGVADVFNSGRTFEESWMGPFGSKRLDNGLLYQTPDFGGFGGEIMLVLDGRGEGSNRVPDASGGVDLWNAALLYRDRRFFVGVTYAALTGDANPAGNREAGDLSQWALGLGYDDGAFSAGLIYEDGELGLGELIDDDRFELAETDGRNGYGFVGYTFGRNKIRVAYGRIDADAVTVTGQRLDGWDNYVAGFEHRLSKRSRIWVEYIGRRDSNAFAVIGDSHALSIGMRHDF